MEVKRKQRPPRKNFIRDVDNTILLNLDNTVLNAIPCDDFYKNVPAKKSKESSTNFDSSQKLPGEFQPKKLFGSQSKVNTISLSTFKSKENTNVASLDDSFDCVQATQFLIGPSTSKGTSESPFLQKAKKLRQMQTQIALDNDLMGKNDAKTALEEEFWSNNNCSGLTEVFNSSDYRKETNDLFDRLESTICDLGTSKAVNIINDSQSQTFFNEANKTAVCVADSTNYPMISSELLGDISTFQSQSDIASITPNSGSDKKMLLDVALLEKTFKSPEIIKRVLKNTEASVKRDTGATPWADDTILANAILNFSSKENNSFADLIKKALLQHSDNSILQPIVDVIVPQPKSSEFKVLGPFYGLPKKVMDLIKLYKGIDKLYEWQEECLNLPAIKSRKNLVYALPTSGGKTLVAEILVLREILCMNKNVIFVLPYVSIVQEKVWALSPFAVALDFLIEEFAAGKGTYPPRKRRRKRSVYIATMEKALGIVDSLIEFGRVGEIGLIVVDELHLVGDEHRGGVLEAMLTKVKMTQEKIHVVGMSATIGNIDEICNFMDADVYSKNFRPVELIEYIKMDNELAKINWNALSEEELFIMDRKLDYNYSREMIQLDPDLIGGLVMEVAPGASCLIFCPSKKNCENVATLLVKILPKTFLEHKKAQKIALLRAIKLETDTVCPILQNTIRVGVAYHHSGLTFEERRLLEEAYRQGVLCVICCTSTLAAGVNLPAKRVILRKPYVGRDFITLSRYKQMVGRAGRAGLESTTGESIVICSKMDLPPLLKLFRSPMDVALSSLGSDQNKGLRHFLLSCISLKMAECRMDLQAVATKTLLSIQSDRLQVNVKKLTDRAISDLFKLGALQIDGQLQKQQEVSVKINTTQGLLSPTESPISTRPSTSTKPKMKLVLGNNNKLIISKMGSASIKSGFELSRAHMLYDDLLQAQTSLVLLDNLHLLYLVTPYDICEQITPPKFLYFKFFNQLGIKELQTAKIIGITEAVASKWMSNQNTTKDVPERVLNRFYVTLMLHDLWNEKSVFYVADKFDVNRGLIQNLMTSASTFASNVVNFCNEFEDFWPFVHLLKGIGQRLQHCSMKELIPLMDLPSVKQSRAKQLFNNGYKTLQSIAKANPEDLVQNIEYMTRKLANQLISAAKLILLEKVENLREEAEDVLDGAIIN